MGMESFAATERNALELCKFPEIPPAGQCEEEKADAEKWVKQESLFTQQRTKTIYVGVFILLQDFT